MSTESDFKFIAAAIISDASVISGMAYGSGDDGRSTLRAVEPDIEAALRMVAERERAACILEARNLLGNGMAGTQSIGWDAALSRLIGVILERT